VTSDDIDDVTITRLFTAARKTMDLPTALRYMVAGLGGVGRRRTPVAVLLVTDEVARRAGTTRDVLYGRQDRAAYGQARAMTWWVLHYRFDLSYPLLGAIFDDRDHSTILKLVAAFGSLLRVDDALRATAEDIAVAVWAELGRKAAA